MNPFYKHSSVEGEKAKKERGKKPGVCTFHSLNLVSHFPPSFSPLLTGKQLRIVEKCVLGWKMQQIKYDSIERMKNQTLYFPPRALSQSQVKVFMHRKCLHVFPSFTFRHPQHCRELPSAYACISCTRHRKAHPARRHRPNDLEPVVQECRHGNTALHKQPQLDATYTFLLNSTCAIGH